MNHSYHSKVQVSYGPCPPEEFAGRFNEKRKLPEILTKARNQGQMVMISGARGSGKTSFLDWAEYEIQNKPGGLESPTIKKAFLETPGMIFTTYKDLLTELKEHQKFGWFKRALDNPNVKKSIEVVLGVLEKASSLAGPVKVGIKSGVVATRAFLPAETVEYSQLLSSFLIILRSLSGELTKNEQFFAILCDDAQWSSEPDFHLLKDLIRNLPPGIAFIIAFRLESESMEKYVELRQELDRFGHTEIRLSGMTTEEIKDFANLRYGLSVNNSTAQFLSMNIGDPFCLVSCFNLLRIRNLDPSLVNVQKVLPEAVDPARCIYSELDQQWRDRVDSLSILHPPLLLSLIACMLGTKESDIVRLQDELNQSVVFRRLARESYDFAHPSLREYRRKELPESVMIRLHSQAAKCFEALRDRFPEWFVDLSLAEHLFFGREYKKALKSNLQLSGRLYDLFNFNLALQMTDRAKICAEKTNNKRMLAVALHRKGLTLQSIFRFSDSLDAYNQSLVIEREIGDKSGEARTLHQIGRVHELTNHFNKALKYYNQSLVIEREIGDKSGEAQTLHQIGRVHQLTNHFNEALKYYNQSLVIEREIGDKSGEAISLRTIKVLKEKMREKKEK